MPMLLKNNLSSIGWKHRIKLVLKSLQHANGCIHPSNWTNLVPYLPWIPLQTSLFLAQKIDFSRNTLLLSQSMHPGFLLKISTNPVAANVCVSACPRKELLWYHFIEFSNFLENIHRNHTRIELYWMNKSIAVKRNIETMNRQHLRGCNNTPDLGRDSRAYPPLLMWFPRPVSQLTTGDPSLASSLIYTTNSY